MTVEAEDNEADDNDVAERARAWVVRLASGETTDDDLAALTGWLGESARHARAFEAERAFWQRLGPLQATFERLEQDDLQKEAQVAAPQVSPLRPRRRLRAALPAAAALAACLLLVFAPDLTTALRADFRTGADAVRTVTLADGSRVTLDRNSAIAVDIAEGPRRVELLQGEAFFEVAPDAARPFRVRAGGGVSEAVGTAYAVRLEDGGARVAVTAGKVAVSTAAAPEAARALKAGEAISYTAGGGLGAVVGLDTARALAWRQGRVVLVARPLAAALAELDRYQPGRILLLAGDRPAAPVSGVIDLAHLDAGIAALAATHGLTIHHLTPYLTVLR